MNNHQSRILTYIKRYIQHNGLPPTIRAIRDDCGISSTSEVARHLNALEAAGHITREPGAARAIRLTDGGQDSGKLLAQLWQTIGQDGQLQVGESDPELAREIIERVR